LRDAALICLNQIGDIQLAIAITRAYEGDDGPVLKEILETRVLPEAAIDGNRWMASWAFWMLGRRDMAVRSLIVSNNTSALVVTVLISLVLCRIPYPLISRLPRDSWGDTSSGQIISFQRPCTSRPIQTIT
jgi:hypothetical protein